MKSLKLSDIFELQMGKTPNRKEVDRYWRNGKNYWVSIADITNSSKYITYTKEKITDNAVDETGIKLINKNTIIMSFKLSVGKTAITTMPLYTNEAIIAFIDKGLYDIDINYMYYLFSNKDWSLQANKAVKGITLNKAQLSQVKIKIPDINCQKMIAEKLDILENIIQKREEQLVNFDNIIRSQFIEMFGDPKNNEKYWKKHLFGDICTVRQGLQIPIKNRITEKTSNCYEYITVSYLHGTKEREYIKEPKKTVICNKDDILMTRTGNTGMVITDVEGVFHNNFFLIDFDRNKFSKRFMVEYLNLEYIQADILRHAGSSTIPDLTHSEFYKISIYEPHIELQKVFETFAEQVDKSKFGHFKESLKLLNLLKKPIIYQ